MGENFVALQWLAGRADEIPQSGDIGTVGTDAACIYGQAETLGEIQIHAGIIQFGKAEALSGLHTIHAGRIDGPRWPMTLPRAASQLVELFPVTFLPSVHRSHYPCAEDWMPNCPAKFPTVIPSILCTKNLCTLASHILRPRSGQRVFFACCIKHVNFSKVSHLTGAERSAENRRLGRKANEAVKLSLPESGAILHARVVL